MLGARSKRTKTWFLLTRAGFFTLTALLGWSAQALGLKAMLFADGAGGT